jgi:hypothetical protein
LTCALHLTNSAAGAAAGSEPLPSAPPLEPPVAPGNGEVIFYTPV